MCGFIGEIAPDLLNSEEFSKLLQLSAHRGPDQQGVWSNEICRLGFNRLSIIDLSENAKQPLLSPSGKFSMVFNGEIYNYKELQAKYAIKDTDLRSGSDSEVLVHLLEILDIETFSKELNGMFAIAVFNIETKQLHLIRDFAGIKPLFYGCIQDKIIFASQFNQVFGHSSFSEKKIRVEIMKEYFGLGYMQAPNTIFENIFQVEPGQIITWSFQEKKIINKSYFFVWQTQELIDELDAKAIQEFQKVISKSVNKQLNADVPLATFLSGGIDSSLIATFSKKSRPDIKAFTFGIDDPQHNESDIAAKIAKQLDINHVIDEVSEGDILAFVEEHFKYFSEPIGDYSTIPTYLITKRAKKHATVMLSGDGGDELFWGYPRFKKSVEQAYWFYLPLSLRKIIIPLARRFNKKLSGALDILPTFDSWILHKKKEFQLLDELFPNVNFSNELLTTYNYKKPLNRKSVLRYLKQNEFYSNMQQILKKVDLMSMGNSIEVRVPFLDKEVIQFSNSLVPEYGIKHERPKYILRETLKQFVNKDIVDLPKKGFTVPYDKWLNKELREDFINLVVNTPLYGENHLNKEVLNKLRDDFCNAKKLKNPMAFWYLYVWQKWAINNELI